MQITRPDQMALESRVKPLSYEGRTAGRVATFMCMFGDAECVYTCLLETLMIAHSVRRCLQAPLCIFYAPALVLVGGEGVGAEWGGSDDKPASLSLQHSDRHRGCHFNYCFPDRSRHREFGGEAGGVAKAIDNPDSQEAVDEYLRLMPKSDATHYIIEGDLRITRLQLIEYLRTLKSFKGKELAGTELKVAKDPATGELSWWKAMESRRITFSVDTASFSVLGTDRADVAVEDVKAAGNAWSAACPECKLDFVFVPPEQAGQDFSRVVFVVRLRNVDDGTLAMSFFPYDYLATKQPQTLFVYPGYYTSSFDRVGIMRHELGHVLGYRHEHIDNVPGCFTEDNDWKALTPRDSLSVMHYLCGGGGSMQLKLSPFDVAAHRCLYMNEGKDCPTASPSERTEIQVPAQSATAAEPITAAARATLDFKSGNAADEWAKFAKAALDLGVIHTESVPIGSRKSLCEVYLRRSVFVYR